MPTTALLWAVHGDFLRYMQRIEDGQVAVLDGVEQLPDGRFRFPAAPDDATDDDARHGAQPSIPSRFRGAVSCTGHHGLLAVRIAAPELHRQDGTTAVLSIDDPFAPGRRMPMAELQSTPQDPTLFTVSLTEEGGDLFQGVYPTGMTLAPVCLEHQPDRSSPAGPQTPTLITHLSTEDPS